MWQIPDAIDTVVCAPDDGWRYHPKHVEQFPDINKTCNVASCWIYIGILLRCTGPWTLNSHYDIGVNWGPAICILNNFEAGKINIESHCIGVLSLGNYLYTVSRSCVYHKQGLAVSVTQKVKCKGKGKRTENIRHIFEEKLQGPYYRVYGHSRLDYSFIAQEACDSGNIWFPLPFFLALWFNLSYFMEEFRSTSLQLLTWHFVCNKYV